MPISLNNSNISVQYNTGCNYIIETVKSDVFVRDTVGTTSNLFAEPTTVPSRTPTTPASPVRHKLLTFTTGTYTINFPFSTVVNINNRSDIILRGEYNIVVGASSSVIPFSTNPSKTVPLPLTLGITQVTLLYHLLNPIKTTEGAQWTYTWSITSDRRIKENIVKASYEKCLENVNKIELYNFNFKDNCVNTNDKHQLGFIAQEVREVYPKAVEVNKMILNTNETIDDILTLNTTQIDYTLYGAVKNLIEKIDNIDIELENLGSNITYNKDLIRNTSNIFSIITSNISITTSNIFTGTSNISITTSNISIKTSNIFISTSNIPTETSNIPTETSNIPTETSNIPIYTSYIPFDTSNISIN